MGERKVESDEPVLTILSRTDTVASLILFVAISNTGKEDDCWQCCGIRIELLQLQSQLIA